MKHYMVTFRGEWRQGSAHSQALQKMEISDELHVLAALPWEGLNIITDALNVLPLI
jgi:hypothetical protein